MSTDAAHTDTAPAPDAAPRADADAGRFFAAARLVAGLTVASRVAGLVRDGVLARVLGVGAVSSAFNFAFVIPNTFRRLFGEGALSAAFIPEYARLLKSDSQLARRFASATMAALLVVLCVITLIGEAALLLALRSRPGDGLAIRLIMIMLPFMPLVCGSAILAGILQTHGSFGPGAAAPIVLNGCAIVAASVYGWAMDLPLEDTAVAVAWSVTASGVITLFWALAALRRHESWTRVLTGVSEPFYRMLRRMLPVVIGLGALQINTLIDGLIASRPVLTDDPMILLPFVGAVAYPLDEGANAALAFAQRLYQFPLGVFGVAIATVALPAMAREADDPEKFNAILRRGVRSCLFIGVPASVGLIAVRHDLVQTIFAGGEFTREDGLRVSRVLAGYAPAVWAYVLTQTLMRSFYARGDTWTPMKISLSFVAANFALNCALIWPLAEAGLAWATTISGIGQCLVVLWIVSRRSEGALVEASFRRTALQSLGLTALMAAVLWAFEALLPGRDGATWPTHTLRLGVMLAAGGGVYLAGARLLRMEELGWLLERASRR